MARVLVWIIGKIFRIVSFYLPSACMYVKVDYREEYLENFGVIRLSK